jgi:hypothetical protein
MNDEPGFVATVLRDLLASTAVILAAWGALGGATNDAHHECVCETPSGTSCLAG